ncbi:MAG: hypothetical protein AAGA56_20770, partial [Myxococcota bacterium]
FHRKKSPERDLDLNTDPGLQAADEMRAYLAAHHPDATLMPGTFRGLEPALALAGFARLSLPPKLLALIDAESERPLSTREALPPTDALHLDKAGFESAHRAHEVASAKLAGGVQNLNWAVVAQEKQLADWISARQDAAAERSTLALFRTWDYDGDGYIDREEWSGTEEVFNALDRNNDGRISLEEMALGLGAPPPPSED